jgi:uncharacterized protein (DUF983 family)
MFTRVTRAYAVLERGDWLARSSERVGYCSRCGDLEALSTGLDGNPYCRTCLTKAEGKRALPAPPMIVVSFTATLIGLLAASVLLAAWVATTWQPYWWAAVATCGLAVVAMVAVCLVVQYAAPSVPRRIRSGGSLRRWRRRLAR